MNVCGYDRRGGSARHHRLHTRYIPWHTHTHTHTFVLQPWLQTDLSDDLTAGHMIDSFTSAGSDTRLCATRTETCSQNSRIPNIPCNLASFPSLLRVAHAQYRSGTDMKAIKSVDCYCSEWEVVKVSELMLLCVLRFVTKTLNVGE